MRLVRMNEDSKYDGATEMGERIRVNGILYEAVGNEERVAKVTVPKFDGIKRGCKKLTDGKVYDNNVFVRKSYGRAVVADVFVDTVGDPDMANFDLRVVIPRREDRTGLSMVSVSLDSFGKGARRSNDEVTWSATFDAEEDAIATFDRGVRMFSKVGLPLGDDYVLMDVLADLCDDIRTKLRLTRQSKTL